MQIATAITTSPRKVAYLNGLIKSLPVTLMDCTVIAEPGSPETPDNKTIIHKEKKGCFHNWDFALRYLLKKSNSPFVCVLQDDIEFTSHYLANSLQPEDDVGFYSFYTPVFYKSKVTLTGWQVFNNGWYSVGACALLFPRKSAETLLNNEVYLNHLATYTKNQQIDAIVCSVFQKLGLPTYYHKPSLCRHIGEVSSIGHDEMKNITDPL